MLRKTALIPGLLLLCLAPSATLAQVWTGPAGIEVQVSSKGKAVAGAKVQLRYREAPTGSLAVLTDSRGRAALVNLAPGAWNVEVSHPDYLSYVAAVTLEAGRKASETTSFLQATGTGRLSIRVKYVRASGPIGTPLDVPPPAPRPAEPIPAPTTTAPPPAPEPEPEPVELREPDIPAPTAPPPAAEPEPAPEPEPEPEPAPTELRQPDIPEPTPPPAPEPEPMPEPEPVAPEPMPEPEPEPEATPEPEPAPMEPPPAPEPMPEPEPAAPEPMAEPEPQPVEPPPAPEPMPEPMPEPEPTAPEPMPEPEPAEPEATPEPEPAPVAPPAAPEPMPEPEPEPAAPQPPAAPAPADPVEAPPVPEPEPEPEPEPPAPAPAAPVVDSPEPAETDEPEAEEPAPAPPAAPPAPSPSLRAFQDRTCPECKPGEWSIASVEVADPAADGAGCVADAADRARTAARLLARSPQGSLSNFAGPAIGGVSPTALELVPAATRDRISQELSWTGPSCRLLAAALPRGARFTGFRYEAADERGQADCAGDRDCPIGESRFLGNPGIERGAETTVIFAVFENRSTDSQRRARLTAYFVPSAGWRP